jgi:hypothetical protein
MSQYSIPPPKEWAMKPTREGSARPEKSTPWRSPVSVAAAPVYGLPDPVGSSTKTGWRHSQCPTREP